MKIPVLESLFNEGADQAWPATFLKRGSNTGVIAHLW